MTVPTGLVTCGGCGCQIDPDVCGCGGSISHSPWEGHTPIPAGCQCGLDKRPAVEDFPTQGLADAFHKLFEDIV